MTLETLGETGGSVVPVLNKVDAAPDLASRHEALADAVSEWEAEVCDPITASALTGAGVDDLRAALGDALPTAETVIEVPNCGGAQALLSWAYDSGGVSDVAYEGGRLSFRFSARPDVVERAERKASTVDKKR